MKLFRFGSKSSSLEKEIKKKKSKSESPEDTSNKSSRSNSYTSSLCFDNYAYGFGNAQALSPNLNQTQNTKLES